MSAQKKKRSIVQGGWASSKSANIPQKLVQNTETSKFMDGVSENESARRFEYEFSNEEHLQKPPIEVIRNSGIYDLSETTENGKSTIILLHNFIEAEEHDSFFDALSNEIPWGYFMYNKRDQLIKNRQMVWYDDVEHMYGGIKHETNSDWPPLLRLIQERVELNSECNFNSVLCNLYKDGKDHVPWHTDQSPSLKHNPTIASVTLGALRVFEMKQKVPKKSPLIGFERECHIPLDGGSLLIMKGAVQSDWLHRIPIEYHDKTARINLTYRHTYTCL